MHQKKYRPIHDEYKINQQKNQKDIRLNESILKTNISEINESQDEKSQYNNQEKIKKKKYNDRENRFMKKKTKRKDTDSETDSKYAKHFKREKRNKITFIKTYDSDSESEEKLLNTRIGLKESIPQEKELKTINVLSKNQKINESDLLNKFNDNNTVDKIMRNKNKINFKENLLHIEYDQENLKNEENVNKQIKIIEKFEQQDEKYEQQKKKRSEKEKEENYIEISPKKERNIESIIQDLKNSLNDMNKKIDNIENVNKVLKEYIEKNPISNREQDINNNLDDSHNKMNVKFNEMVKKIGEVENSIENKIENSENKIGKKIGEIKNSIKNEVENSIENKIENSVENKIGKKVSEAENKMEEEIKDLKVSLNIMNEIMNQKDIYYKRCFKYLNRNLKMILNSYKIIYMRKFANLSLNEIYKKYKKYLGIGKIGKYNIIAFYEKKYNIDGFNIHHLNLLIDFLRFIWDTCSDIIHLNDKNFPLQKEIFCEYMGAYSGKKINNIKGNLGMNELIGIIFENNEIKTNKTNKNETKNNNIIIAIKNIINKKFEEEHSSLHSSDLDFEKENLVIELSDSEESDETFYEYDENEIKNIILKDTKNISIKSQIIKLIHLINKNAESIKLIVDENEEIINGEYLYKLWIKSFDSEIYKQSEKYKKYFDKTEIITFKKMGKMLCKIFDGKKFNIFIEDPKGSIKLINKKLP